ncbi:hypothetical protein [Inhella proteolytica]|uniref:Uncharacterized protein n=1 Tax=Inhella proteolytica TaxID=2795029 RepID=A0A931NJN9_9BURK|nr:hypothetical protein [Inhella proteolytica]MBH9578840.1 hypothetical protein [Inhella proteolytica]
MTARREFWPLLLAAALLAAYLAVLSRPAEVGERYRLFFIERAVRAWNNGQDPLLRLGERLDFRQELPQRSLDGWSVAEPAGTWTQGRRAGLTLHLAPGENPGRLLLDLEPFLAPQRGLDAQPLIVFLNGQRLGEWAVQGPQTLNLALPPGSGPLLRLRFELPRAQSPRVLGVSPDGRALALRFRWLQIE